MKITIIKYGKEALPEIKQCLLKGHSVVLPNPSPLPYMVVAISPTIINSVKNRSLDQSVASFIGNFESIKSYLDLNPDGLGLTKDFLLKDKMTVLCPVKNKADAPAFLLPSIKEDHVLLFAAHLKELKQLCLELPSLYVSSGNVTGMKPQQLCQDVQAQFKMFGNPALELLIVDGDHLRDQKQLHGSTTMVKISRTNKLSLERQGVQKLQIM